ncbi:MAG: lipoyl synthase [Candidatus Glassbacteria bacterium]
MERRGRLPSWFKVRAPGGETYREVKGLIGELRLHTVCQSALCPNIGSCWERRTATFMILGDTCTRACRFCGVPTGKPKGLDSTEPERIASAVARMKLRYAVITSVTRDDLSDGGAGTFASTIRHIRKDAPGCKVEVLVPDFRGSRESLDIVLRAGPDVLAHNVETVPRLYGRVRPGADFGRSLALLERAKLTHPSILAKSGIMVGLGESLKEIIDTMENIVKAGVDLFTIGQYLRPNKKSLPIERFVTPKEFEELRQIALSLGFKGVSSGPLVRSSYLAEEQASEHLASLM